MFYVYFLFSVYDSGWYIGYTSTHPIKRFNQHSQGIVRSTKYRRPLRLAYHKQFTSKLDAMKFEWFLKHTKGYQEKLRIIDQIISLRTKWPIIE